MKRIKIRSNRYLVKKPKYKKLVRRAYERIEREKIDTKPKKYNKDKQKKIQKFKDYKKYKIYRQKEKQKDYRTLASIPARLEVDVIVGIQTSTKSMKKVSVTGKASSNNIRRTISSTMRSALQNAMYRAVNKIGQSGYAIWIDSILSYNIFYPKEFRLKRSKGYTQVYLDGSYYLNEKTSYIDFDQNVSYDASKVSEKTINRRELERDSYDYDGWGFE